MRLTIKAILGTLFSVNPSAECGSKDAVTSNWVELEVEVAFHKEVTTSQEILFPIRLDDIVLGSDALWANALTTFI